MSYFKVCAVCKVESNSGDIHAVDCSSFTKTPAASEAKGEVPREPLHEPLPVIHAGPHICNKCDVLAKELKGIKHRLVISQNESLLLTKERDAYKKAKEENDERFQLEINELKAKVNELAEKKAEIMRINRRMK